MQTTITNLSAIAPRYDAFILDLWGVVHDGSHLYPGVYDALVSMRKAGKKIVMLSNAPRRAAKVAKVLNELGVSPDLYDAVHSSGEAGYAALRDARMRGDEDAKKLHSSHLSILTSSHLSYYYIGPAKDADVLDGLDYKRMDDVKDAGFLLNVGFGSEEQSTDDWMPLLRAARGLGLPMVCLNPDLEVVKQTGEHFPCAGVIAHAYARLGGEVIWFGKPFAGVYERCMELFSPVPKNRILAIGDSLETDIPGAVNFGIDSALVTGGILKKYSPQEVEAMCAKLNLAPTYITARLVW